MAFIRTKRVGGREYYQLVENYRENGRHRQRVLAHLGASLDVDAAIERHTKALSDLQSTVRHETMAASTAGWTYEQEDPVGFHNSGGQVSRPDPNARPRVRRRRWYQAAEDYWCIMEEIDAANREIPRLEERIAALGDYRAKRS